MINNKKRELLAQVLRGNTAGLQIYQERQQVDDHGIHLLFDNRPIGGLIEVVTREGTQKELLPDEFNALPNSIRNRCIVFEDYSHV